MGELNEHWTNRSSDDFLFRIAFDYVNQVMNWMQEDDTNRAELARRLGVSKGRVSQVLNDPGNLKLKTAVEFARALNRKIAIVGYDDHDTGNNNGPINGQVFASCWIDKGRPTDMFDFTSCPSAATSDERHLEWFHFVKGSGARSAEHTWLPMFGIQFQTVESATSSDRNKFEVVNHG